MSIDKSEKIAKHLVDVMTQQDVEQNIEHSRETEEWLKNNPSSLDVISTLTDKKIFYQQLERFSSKDVKSESAKMMNRIRRDKRKIRIRYSISIAAAMIAVSLLVWSYSSNDNQAFISEVKTVKLDVPKIIYDNGNEVALINDTEISGDNELIVKKSGENSVQVATTQNKVEYGKLVIPDKTTYTITLSDGTVVHLNANSTLVFPTKFTEDVRKVELIGEAYFEVAKDAEKEFVVKTKSIDVRVLGTKFNVNTYDVNSTETVLFEGRVAVENRFNVAKMLKPNQIAKISNNGEITVEEVENISRYSAWRSNYFEFSNADINQVAKELSSWYGIELNIIENVEINLTGRYKRDTDLKKIISSLEMVTGEKLFK